MNSKRAGANIRMFATFIGVFGVIGSLIAGKIFEITPDSRFESYTLYNTPVAVCGVASFIILWIFMYILGIVVTELQHTNYLIAFAWNRLSDDIKIDNSHLDDNDEDDSEIDD